MSRSIYIQSEATMAGNASVASPEAVAAGKLVILGADGEGQVGLNVLDTALPERFMLVRGTTGEPARRSNLIYKKDIVGVTFQAYRAPVPQVTTITPTAGSVASGPAGVKITRLDSGFEQYPRVSYEIDVAAGDTVTQAGDKIRAAITAAKAKAVGINNHVRHIVVATGTTTIILTAIVPDFHTIGTAQQEWISFSTQLYGAAAGWTLASTTAPDPGSGSYAQVYEYENRSFGNLGFLYTETPYSQRPAYHATSGVNYDLVTLHVKTNASPEINKGFAVHEHVIAVLAGQLTEANVVGRFNDAPVLT